MTQLYREMQIMKSALAETTLTPAQPIGGQPSPGSKVSVQDLEAQVAYQEGAGK